MESRHPYEKIVVHLKVDFLKQAMLNTPELADIAHLFELSRMGIGFGEESKQALGSRLKQLPQLDKFEQLLELLRILRELSQSEDQQLLHEHPFVNQYTQRDQNRLKEVYAFIDSNYQRKIEISEVAGLSNLTNEAFCRYFKKMTRLTFTAFVNHYRVDKAKKYLLMDKNVTEACFACGFDRSLLLQSHF